MPELPEVEGFRQLLLPLVGTTIQVRRLGDNNHRIKLDDLKEGESIICNDVIRRGKQLCLAVTLSKSLRYIYLHMGMTGQIRVYGKVQNWGELRENGYSGHLDVKSDDETSPPKYTHLIFCATETKYTAYFCDPRKFGSCYLADDLSDLHALAPDALTCTDTNTIDTTILPSLTNQRLGIKAVLLDQKRAVSGVGNWIADEVLYQCGMHPDQTRLSSSEAKEVWNTLQQIVLTAVNSQIHDESYPVHWLFHYRWTGKKAAHDCRGRAITFVTSGGRTSAVVLAQQKLYARTNAERKSGRDDAHSTKVESEYQLHGEEKNSSSKRKRSRQFINQTRKAKEHVEGDGRRRSSRLQALLP